MKTYFSLMRDIRERPEMWVGKSANLFETLHKIELFLTGFEAREAYENDLEVTDFGHKFREFSQKQLGISGVLVLGVAHTLANKHASPSAAWLEFFELISKFEESQGLISPQNIA